jgi:hypothetical protein
MIRSPAFFLALALVASGPMHGLAEGATAPAPQAPAKGCAELGQKLFVSLYADLDRSKPAEAERQLRMLLAQASASTDLQATLRCLMRKSARR